MMRHCLIVVLLSFTQFVIAQDKSSEWFPSVSEFPLLDYDLLETKFYTGILYLNSEQVKYEGAYIPVNIGIRKSFLKWNLFSLPFDFALGAASYTQFEIIRYDENTLRGGLLNTDFKASGYINSSKGPHKFRLQLFHISSHLGDDYMLRNEVFERNNKKVNYEQIDFVYLYHPKNVSLYFGLGEIISTNTFRKRFMAQFGMQGDYVLNHFLDLSFGADVKLYDENNYIPDIHSGVGVTFKKNEVPHINFSIDSFFGHLPYSTLDYGKIFWIGISSKIYF